MNSEEIRRDHRTELLMARYDKRLFILNSSELILFKSRLTIKINTRSAMYYKELQSIINFKYIC